MYLKRKIHRSWHLFIFKYRKKV